MCIFTARLLRSVSCLCLDASKLLLLLLCLFSENVVALQQNVTQAIHQNVSCFSLKAAAESLMLAAQSQTRACQSKQLFLEKQL